MQYQRVDDDIDLIRSMGVGSLMAKADIEKAFRIMPVHPVDYECIAHGMFYFM